MAIRARDENGVFKPLEKVPLKEGTEADVYPRTGEGNGEKPRRSVKDFKAYGMWKDRTDFKDGLDYENHMRKYRKGIGCVLPTSSTQMFSFISSARTLARKNIPTRWTAGG